MPEASTLFMTDDRACRSATSRLSRPARAHRRPPPFFARRRRTLPTPPAAVAGRHHPRRCLQLAAASAEAPAALRAAFERGRWLNRPCLASANWIGLGIRLRLIADKCSFESSAAGQAAFLASAAYFAPPSAPIAPWSTPRLPVLGGLMLGEEQPPAAPLRRWPPRPLRTQWPGCHGADDAWR